MKVILEVKDLGRFDLTECEPWMKIYEDEICIRMSELPEELEDKEWKKFDAKVHIEWDNPIIPVFDIDDRDVEAGFHWFFDDRSEMYFLNIKLK